MCWWCESRLLIANEDGHFSFQIRSVQQMCQDFNSQDFELILRTVSVVYTVLLLKLSEPDKLNSCSLFKVKIDVQFNQLLVAVHAPGLI